MSADLIAALRKALIARVPDTRSGPRPAGEESLADIARAAGIARKNLSRFRSGVATLTVESAVRLAGVLGVDLLTPTPKPKRRRRP